mmetsp:Transcript_116332/g.329676  ORF Transcript_116332/g.329676 Transcript_116332/m.329676 type:complete len:260 (+) Transcript_116332:53-832(+)
MPRRGWRQPGHAARWARSPVPSELVLQLPEYADARGEPLHLVLLHGPALEALEALQLGRDLLLPLLLLLLDVLLRLVGAAVQRLHVAPVRGLLPSLDPNDLHREHEHVAAPDLRRAPAVPVAELRGDVHLPLVALDHELHRLRPALDDLVRREGRRRAPVVGRVELHALRPLLRGAALVVALARGVRQGALGAVAGPEHLVLQARWQCDDALLSLVLLQELLAELVGPPEGEGREEGGDHRRHQHGGASACHRRERESA